MSTETDLRRFLACLAAEQVPLFVPDGMTYEDAEREHSRDYLGPVEDVDWARWDAPGCFIIAEAAWWIVPDAVIRAYYNRDLFDGVSCWGLSEKAWALLYPLPKLTRKERPPVTREAFGASPAVQERLQGWRMKQKGKVPA